MDPLDGFAKVLLGGNHSHPFDLEFQLMDREVSIKELIERWDLVNIFISSVILKGIFPLG